MSPRDTLDAMKRGSLNLRFRDVVRLLEELGFRLVRVNGSHHIFAASNVRELVNLQEVNGRASRTS
jgi:predicted RNA binding protein YcfA (HicA-like mRNA interferase family)